MTVVDLETEVPGYSNYKEKKKKKGVKMEKFKPEIEKKKIPIRE